MSEPTRFSRKSRIAVPASELYAWHVRPGAYERLNPPFDAGRVVNRQGGVEDGGTIELSVPFFGPFRMAWSGKHGECIPGREFSDWMIQSRHRQICG